MAHNLSLNRLTGKYEMAFVGEKPWHHLGQELTKGASIETWIVEAGFAWRAVEKSLQYYKINDDGFQCTVMTDLGKLLTRSDNGEELAIVGPDYNVVQPAEVMEFFRTLTEEEGWHIITAGVLRSGLKLWVQAEREGLMGEAAPGDSGKGRLILATSLDGSLKTTCAFVHARSVCENTLNIALNERGQKRMEISHRSQFDARAIKRQLGLVDSAWDKFMKQTNALANFHVTEDEAVETLRKVFGAKTSTDTLDLSWLSSFDPDIEVVDVEDTRENRNTERALELWQGEGRGSEHKGSASTAWGLLNAVTELVDHEMGRSQDTRLDSAWFGRGRDFKNAAFRELVKLVGCES